MAEIEEIMMCFATLCALESVFKEETAGIAALTCHLFTVEKFHADGTYNKTKSRLVAHGNEQDALMYPDRSSPTVSMHAIMTSLTVAANNRGMKLAKIDVKGAFIQTEMRGSPVYIRCHKKLTELIVEVLPGIRQYVCRDGTLYCRLLKALYGCVQASKLWYDKLSAFLTGLGYQRCPVEPCVMKRVVDGKVYQLLIYVDDILIIAEEAEFERLRAAFTKQFRWITMEVNDSLSYLGMQIALGKGYVELDTIFYIDKALQNYKDIVEQPAPGTKELFEIGQSALLDDDARKQFHMTVARLLYLSKRARPDIVTVVAFLCTRVKSPTVEDQQKLECLLGFLKRTREWKCRLEPQGVFSVVADVDASFAIHADSKSQTGCVIFVAGVPVYCSLKKQKCMMKSPTEQS
jgi:hypothetical protein